MNWVIFGLLKGWLRSLETGTFREVEQSNVGLAVLTDNNL